MLHWQKNMKRLGALVLALFLAILPANDTKAAGAAQAAPQAVTGLRVDFLDVGQGDAAVVRCGSQSMIIDGGNAEASSYVYTWLKNNGLSYLDYMVASHPDADHVGGLAGALNYAKVGTAYSPVTGADTKTFRSFQKYLTQQGKAITVPQAGTMLPLGDAVIQFLGPVTAGSNDNNNSIVLKIVYGQTSFLFTGDAEQEEEESLINAGADLSSTVLKVGHHGSDTSTSYLFLRTVQPQMAVISVGAGNSYGHPTEAVLSRLRDAGVRTWRTDMQGTVTAVSDGTSVSFSVEKNPDADTLAGAGAGQLSAGTAAGSQTGSGTAAGSGNAGKGSQTAAAVSQAGASASQSDSSAAAYVVNTNTKKFHVPSCPSVQQMKAKNKKTVNASRDALISEGYSPCKRCNP